MDFEKGYHVLPKWLSYNMIWSRVLTKAGRLIVLKKKCQYVITRTIITQISAPKLWHAYC